MMNHTAMKEEALPLVQKFGLSSNQHQHQQQEDDDDDDQKHQWFQAGVPWVRYSGTYKHLFINLIWLGTDPIFVLGRFRHLLPPMHLSKLSAQTLLSTLALPVALSCFQAKGASIADIYLASDVSFHDRRIPIPVFDLYGIGLVQAFPTPNLLNNLKLKVGKLSTGNSLDISPEDEASIILNDATVKDMEGAGVAYVANLMKVPVIFAKGVTDIVDGDKPTAQEFRQNLAAVTVALDRAVTEIVDFINGKALQEL